MSDSDEYEPINGSRAKFSVKRFSFPVLGYAAFVLVLVLFGLCTKLDDNSVPTMEKDEDEMSRVVVEAAEVPMMGSYGMMIDATAMCVMGFGFLYAFCSKYTWGGIVFNFFTCALCFLWCPVCTWIMNVIFHGKFERTAINVTTIVEADLVTAAVLITFGVCYGFLSPCQLIVLCLVEPLAMKFNEHIVVNFLKTSDAGGSILTHAFGAFFGLGLTYGLGVKPEHIPEQNRRTNYMSDTFALVGTIVLWVFWPSFNGALLFNDASLQQRVVINTYLAICSSCVTAIATSSLVHKGKLSILEVQNATLAGGVAIGMSCSFNVMTWVPVLIGGLAGVLSSVGYGKLSTWLESLGVADSAQATQLHGLPGMFGALAAALVVLFSSSNQYFAAETQWKEMGDPGQITHFGLILGAAIVTLVISFVIGLANGVLIRIPICDKVEHENLIEESPYFVLSQRSVLHDFIPHEA